MDLKQMFLSLSSNNEELKADKDQLDDRQNWTSVLFHLNQIITLDRGVYKSFCNRVFSLFSYALLNEYQQA